ncbi:MAG TPA: hypothetical protein VNS32_16680 [Flavisolibacter sp.]|nr:hypothetical protein [Flavisolibacter sp.]
MKYFFMAFLCLSVQGHAQSIALVDLHYKKPITYADKFGTNDIFKELFPVYMNDQDELVKALEEAARYIERNIPPETQTDSLQVGNTLLINTIEILHHKPFYTVRLKTNTDQMSIYISLVDRGSNKRNSQLKLLRFADYLRKGAGYAMNRSK